jgi:hypothetical protein
MKIISDQDIRTLNRRIAEYSQEPSQSLSQAAIDDISALYDAGLVTISMLAKFYDISCQQVLRIIEAKRWVQ